MEHWYFVLLFFIVGLLYASAGHGGASGYLALMALMGIAPEVMRPFSLIMNVLVSGVAFVGFYRAGHFDFKILRPFLWSVPMAWLGAGLKIPPSVFDKVLAVCLLLAAWRVSGFGFPDVKKAIRPVPQIPAVFIGAGIGLLSGMIGIGGGVILSPVLLLAGWADLRKTAATSAAFIFINSVSGLLNTSAIPEFAAEQYVFMVSAVLGGICGTALGAKYMPMKHLRILLSLGLGLACIKLFFR